MPKEREQIAREHKISPEMPYYKIVNYESLLGIVQSKQGEGMSVVLTTGAYDIAHFKHAEALACIKMFGDFLVVGVPSDEEIIAASSSGRQNKDRQGPIVEYEKRVKMIAHFSYVDLVFSKTKSKKTLIEEIKPDFLVQSITSGISVVREVLELTDNFEYFALDEGLFLNLGERRCKLVFIDDINEGETKIIPPNEAVDSAEQWDRDRFVANRFNGTLIKQRIIQRALGER